jgi:hypothetical protein
MKQIDIHPEVKTDPRMKAIPQRGHCRNCELNGAFCYCGCRTCLETRKRERDKPAATERYLLLDLPLKTVSEINRRDHWTARSKRRKAQQLEVHVEWKAKIGTRRIKLPCKVSFKRIGPKMLDDDNLRSACKHVRDEVARLLGSHDGFGSPVTWHYDQEAIGKHEYRLRIEVESEN